MKKCEKNIVESRRNSRIKTVEPPVKPTLENNPSASPLNSRRKNLILKHEILSPECDLFKASTPRRLHVVLLGKAAALVLVGVLASFYALRWEFGDEVERWAVGLAGLMGVLCLTSVTVMLLQTIEGTAASVYTNPLTVLFRADPVHKRIGHPIQRP